MGDDLDVDALLEEPYMNRDKEHRKDERRDHEDNNGSDRGSESRSGGRKSKDRRSRSRSHEQRSSRDDQKQRRRSGSRERSRRSRSRERRRSRSRERSRKRSRSCDRMSRQRSRSRDRSLRERQRSTSRERPRRSRSRDRRRSSPLPRRSSPPPRRGSSPSYYGGGRYRSGGRSPRSRSPPEPLLTPEERDARTVFIMQLSQRVKARDVEEFFSSVGKIRDVKLIVCNKTRRFKGICYVEFRDLESVPLALGLNGQKLLGVPVIVQPSQAEKNRLGSYVEASPRGAGAREKGPVRLYVGSLHFNITEDMLKAIFEPFGKIQSIQLIMDPETSRSKGYGFVTYADAEDSKKALEQLNGFELAGRPMKVGHVTERTDAPVGPPGLDSDELDRAGIDLGATGRLALMAKLAEGTGLKLPQAANQALSSAAAASANHASPRPYGSTYAYAQQQQLAKSNPPIATQCFMLSSMFDPAQEAQINPTGWDLEVRDDVIEECNKYGGILHIVVDKVSPAGHVYVKCPNVATAVSAVNALHGRWFAGKIIAAAYVPTINYLNLFPDSISAIALLQTKR